MKLLKSRVVLCLAALSPAAVFVVIDSLPKAAIFVALALSGAVSVAIASVSVSARVSAQGAGKAQARQDAPKRPKAPKTYHSILRKGCVPEVKRLAPDGLHLRAHMRWLAHDSQSQPGFLNGDDQIRMVLDQIIARWGALGVSDLSDDQLRELWLTERLLRATPAEAGTLSSYFAAPDAMLTMRDRVADMVAA